MIQKPRIRIAFQGGGAKLMPLLAVADAVQSLIEKDEIEVVALSGTSAGAIVASLVANEIPAREVAHRLVSKGPAYIDRVVGRENVATGSFFQRLRLARKIANSKPIGDIAELEAVLTEIVKACDPRKRSEFRMGGCSIPLKVIVSNLVKSDTEVFCSSEDGNRDILRAVVDSCALPIFFRTQLSLSGSPFVDGGLYDNFPTEVLLEGCEADEVVGVSFSAPVEKPIGSVVSYIARLMFSSIDQSVRRSSRLIPEDNVLRISTDLDTLDFETAVAQGPTSDVYGDTREDALEWFRRRVEKSNSIQGRKTFNDLLRDNYKVYEKVHSNTPRRATKTSLVATLNLLAPEGDPRHTKYTEMRNESTFEAVSEPVVAMSITTGNSIEQDPLVQWRMWVCDQNKKKIDFTVVPGIRTIQTPNDEPCEVPVDIVYFSPPLSVESDRSNQYTVVRTQYQLDGLVELKEVNGEAVEFGIGNSTPIAHQICDIVIRVPEEFPEIVAEPVSGQDREYRALTDSELAEYGNESDMFRTLGWRTCDLGQDEYFVLLLKSVG